MRTNLVSAKQDLLFSIASGRGLKKDYRFKNKVRFQFFTVYKFYNKLSNDLRQDYYRQILINTVGDPQLASNAPILLYYLNTWAFQNFVKRRSLKKGFKVFTRLNCSFIKRIYVSQKQILSYRGIIKKVVYNLYKFNTLHIQYYWRNKLCYRLLRKTANLRKIKKLTHEVVNLQHCFIQPNEICITYTITNNNIIVNCVNTATRGVVFTLSSSRLGFRGRKKLSMYAFVLISQTAVRALRKLSRIDLCVQFKISPFFNKKMMLNSVVRTYQRWFENFNQNFGFNTFQNNINTRELLEMESFDSYYTIFKDCADITTKRGVSKRCTLTIQLLHVEVFNGCRLKKLKHKKVRTKQRGKFWFAWKLCKRLPSVTFDDDRKVVSLRAYARWKNA